MKATKQNRMIVAFIVICNGVTTDSYTYGNSNWPDLLTKYKGHTISYDAIGNPTSWYDGAALREKLSAAGFVYDAGRNRFV